MAKPDVLKVEERYKSLVKGGERLPYGEVQEALYVAALMTEVVRGDPGAGGVAGLIATGILVLDETNEVAVLGAKNLKETGVWSGNGKVAGGEVKVEMRQGRVLLGEKVFEIQNLADEQRIVLPGRTENSHNHVGVALLQNGSAWYKVGRLFDDELSEEGKKEDNTQIVDLAKNVIVWAYQLGRGSGEVRVRNGLQLIAQGIWEVGEEL